MKKLILIVLLAPLGLVQAQDTLLVNFANGIRVEEMKEHLRILASPEFEGRGTGQPGLRKASEYLQKQFSDMNLEGPSPVGNPYFQEFKLTRGGWQEIEIISGSDTLNSQKSLTVVGNLPKIPGQHEIIFAGFGIDHENYSDLKDLDVAGKVVAFIGGEPKDKNGRYLVSGSFLPEFTDRGISKAKELYHRGALAAIRIDPSQEQAIRAVKMMERFRSGGQYQLEEEAAKENRGSGVIQIGIEDANRLFQLKAGSLEKVLEKMEKGKVQSGLFRGNIEIQSSEEGSSILTENVVAFLPGTELKDEIVIITAHFDHLGKRDGQIYYGADDNATGTAAVIEVAEAFAEMAAAGIHAKRSILFMPVAGEERGLLGSKYYVKNPLFPLDKTRASINMDMIGRSDQDHESNPNYVYVYMNDSVNSKMDLLVQGASQLVKGSLFPEYKYRSDNDFRMGGSDHASFEEVNIPVLYFFCGTHPDYHRTTDTWDKVEYGKLTSVTRMVFSALWKLANE